MTILSAQEVLTIYIVIYYIKKGQNFLDMQSKIIQYTVLSLHAVYLWYYYTITILNNALKPLSHTFRPRWRFFLWGGGGAELNPDGCGQFPERTKITEIFYTPSSQNW